MEQHNWTTGGEYTGKNVEALLVAQVSGGYAEGRWSTYKQAAENGRQVRKGEHGTSLIRVVTKDVVTRTGRVERKRVVKSFTVFNIEQTDPADALVNA